MLYVAELLRLMFDECDKEEHAGAEDERDEKERPGAGARSKVKQACYKDQNGARGAGKTKRNHINLLLLSTMALLFLSLRAWAVAETLAEEEEEEVCCVVSGMAEVGKGQNS